MKHSVLIQNGLAHEIWPGRKKRLAKLIHADLYAQIVEVDGEVTIGDVWDGTAFAQPPQEDRTERIRARRNHLLKDSDWTQIPDAPVDREAWAAYRQALRDITGQPGFPDAVEWPVKP